MTSYCARNRIPMFVRSLEGEGRRSAGETARRDRSTRHDSQEAKEEEECQHRKNPRVEFAQKRLAEGCLFTGGECLELELTIGTVDRFVVLECRLPFRLHVLWRGRQVGHDEGWSARRRLPGHRHLISGPTMGPPRRADYSLRLHRPWHQPITLVIVMYIFTCFSSSSNIGNPILAPGDRGSVK